MQLPVVKTKRLGRDFQVLLRSDKGVANFSDRSLLKNLGHWLGLLTLARNKPILQLVSSTGRHMCMCVYFFDICLCRNVYIYILSLQDIDLKSLLYEAYHKGSQELLYVVPFVAKVIESCAKSKVNNELPFHPRFHIWFEYL